MQLVSIADVVPTVRIDLRYASDRNTLGRPLYDPHFSARLRPEAAAALVRATAFLEPAGYRLVVWDAYRPPEVQLYLLDAQPSARDTYVLTDSNHCQGLAVDVTLMSSQGAVLDMGTDHDEFSSRAHINATGLTAEQQGNRKTLMDAMVTAGFSQWPYEWWHYDFANVQ